MKSIIIVTASTGAGHNQAAANLKLKFESQGIYVHIVDMFKSTSKSMNTLVADGYKLLATRLPKAYGMIYKSADNRSFNRFVSKNVFLATEYRLKWIFNEFKPDLVISTHPFGAPIVGKLKEKGKITVPFVQIVTDFKAHYAYIHPQVDIYITASQYTANSLIERGIHHSKVFAYGIPTKEEFTTAKPREFSSDKPFNMLIMGGSMGLNAMARALDQLLRVKQNLKLTVVCGKNEELYQQFSHDYRAQIKTGQLAVLGFVDNIYELMDNADLIVSKPGGLTTTEAIQKCIPMIIPFAIPGQEQENTQFLVENQMAIEVQAVEDLYHHIEMLINDREYYQKMVVNMLSLSKTYSVDAIIKLCVDLIEGKA